MWAARYKWFLGTITVDKKEIDRNYPFYAMKLLCATCERTLPLRELEKNYRPPMQVFKTATSSLHQVPSSTPSGLARHRLQHDAVLSIHGPHLHILKQRLLFGQVARCSFLHSYFFPVRPIYSIDNWTTAVAIGFASQRFLTKKHIVDGIEYFTKRGSWEGRLRRYAPLQWMQDVYKRVQKAQ